jgi:hypothetical protein
VATSVLEARRSISRKTKTIQQDFLAAPRQKSHSLPS